jgi:transglutaminase 1
MSLIISDDITYMSDPDLLNEYVLEDVGKIWFGPHSSAKGRHW